MVALRVSLFRRSLSSSYFASIYFSCHVVPLFPIMQSLLLALHGPACSNSQWEEIHPACTDSCWNKCTWVCVKELLWQRVTSMFTRKRNSCSNNTLLCSPFNTTLYADCTIRSRANEKLCSGVDEVSVLLGYAAGSPGIWFQKFWDNVLVTPSRIEMSTISALEAETTTLCPNVGEHIPSDADVMSLKK